MNTYFIPTKPYTLIQFINYRAAATGSPGLAMQSHHADFNGHSLSLSFNDFRQYYVGQYWWAGRHVVTRSTDFAKALAEMKREYARQGAGARLLVVPHKEEDEKLLMIDPDFLVYSQELDKQLTADWWTWQFDYVNTALRMNTTGQLIKATTPEEYLESIRPKVARMADEII